MFKNHYETLSHPLTVESASAIADFMLSGMAQEVEIAALLASLNNRSDNYEIMTGFSKVVKSKAMNLNSHQQGIMDVCGTGGDGHNTFNISTTVAILLSCKLQIAKHGNSSVSSRSGSADVLRHLGIPFYTQADMISRVLEQNGFVFLFAPDMHPSMKVLMPVRKTLAIPTIFNRIGPLCNPVPLTYQIIGVYEKSLMLPMAKAMQDLGIKRGAVIHGHLGMDELSTTGINHVIYVTPHQLRHDLIDPTTFGMPYAQLQDYVGGDAMVNAEITRKVLSGLRGPKQDIVALNAGLALYIAEVCPTISEGVQMAYKLLNRHVGLKKLNELTGERYEHTR